jgi:hypothetical protein
MVGPVPPRGDGTVDCYWSSSLLPPSFLPPSFLPPSALPLLLLLTSKWHVLLPSKGQEGNLVGPVPPGGDGTVDCYWSCSYYDDLEG